MVVEVKVVVVLVVVKVLRPLLMTCTGRIFLDLPVGGIEVEVVVAVDVVVVVVVVVVVHKTIMLSLHSR